MAKASNCTENRTIMSYEDNNRKRLPSTASIMRATFGIFMIVIYVGMGILFLIDFFGWDVAPWGWLRWIVGPVMIIYGFWRAYRQFAGIDRNFGDEEE